MLDVLGTGSGCPSSLQDFVLIRLATEAVELNAQYGLMIGEKLKMQTVLFRTIVFNLAEGWQAAGKQEDKTQRPREYTRRPI